MACRFRICTNIHGTHTDGGAARELFYFDVCAINDEHAQDIVKEAFGAVEAEWDEEAQATALEIQYLVQCKINDRRNEALS